MTVRVLSAGAAKGLVGDVQTEFEASSGVKISGSFSAVGAIRERFESGEGCDVLILTARQLAELEAAGSVRVAWRRSARCGPRSRSRRTGSSRTSRPAQRSQRRCGRRASVYMPDAYQEHGRHPRALGAQLRWVSKAEMASKLRMFPQRRNGDADAGGGGARGRHRHDADDRDPLHAWLGASRTAAAGARSIHGLCRRGEYQDASMPDEAEALVALLTGTATAGLRQRSGFE